jgi:hypothetical protein
MWEFRSREQAAKLLEGPTEPAAPAEQPEPSPDTTGVATASTNAAVNHPATTAEIELVTVDESPAKWSDDWWDSIGQNTSDFELLTMGILDTSMEAEQGLKGVGIAEDARIFSGQCTRTIAAELRKSAANFVAMAEQLESQPNTKWITASEIAERAKWKAKLEKEARKAAKAGA